MTVDLLAATCFWPEGTFLHVPEDIASDGENEELRSTGQDSDPSMERQGETFLAAVLRQIGWPLPKAASDA